MQRVERKEYLNWLVRWRERQIIKVVSGVRRCGKSTLFEIYADHLLENGVDPDQIIAINFEDVDNEKLTDYRILYEYVTSRLLTDKMNYIFLDEIQHVVQFEKAVDSLFLKSNCDVYITGSNAYFMSGELATLLSGRYVELKMLPLSFREFCTGISETLPQLTKPEQLRLYMEIGSFPYSLRIADRPREAKEYLRDIYNSVLLKDIVARLRITDVNNLENVTKFLLHNIGSRTSTKKISDTLKSQGKGIDQKTIDKYLRGLTDSLMIYEAKRYNIKGRQYLTTQSKYYSVDVGLRNVLVRGSESDQGHILENIVYLELLRRGYDVYVGQIESGEVDFFATRSAGTAYFQVAASTMDENVLRRELLPFKKIPDNYPKYLLTLDEYFADVDYDGIQKMNLLDWLLTTP